MGGGPQLEGNDPPAIIIPVTPDPSIDSLSYHVTRYLESSSSIAKQFTFCFSSFKQGGFGAKT